jgi:hypothetical protein
MTKHAEVEVGMDISNWVLSAAIDCQAGFVVTLRHLHVLGCRTIIACLSGLGACCHNRSWRDRLLLHIQLSRAYQNLKPTSSAPRRKSMATSPVRKL